MMDMGITLDDIAKSEGYEILGPAYFAARRASEALFAGRTETVSTDPYKAMVDKTTKHIQEALYDYAENYIMGDLENNIASRVQAMVDDTVTALLSGDEWAMKRYPLGPYSDGEKIRAAVAKHAGESLLTMRIAELEKDNRQP